ncbi:MAG: lamin tail domain-containing protein [Chitinophagaceae bacterium]
MKLTAVLLFFLLPITMHAQNRYDIVIDEIMADPTPQIGLPNNEWIELKNVSVTAINLQGWRIADASGQSGPMPNYKLQPDSFVIVCTGSAVAAMSAFGKTISVTSFPSLDNDGETIFLKSASGAIIHAVNYNLASYKNPIKEDGGWTLEMIDTKNPCNGSNNWTASNNESGGTPGRKNSVDAINIDDTAPKLINGFVTDSQTIHLVFDEPLDSLNAAVANDYGIDGDISIITASPLAPLFNEIELKVNPVLSADKFYNITVSNVSDCRGNSIQSDNIVRIALPADAGKSDLVINEILFNPKPGGYDYIELYNSSNKTIDGSKVYIANRNSSSDISSAKALSEFPFYIFPGDYVVLTQDAESLQRNYLVKNPKQVRIISSMPSYPDDDGDVVVINIQGDIIDEVKYDEAWHFKLIDNDEGVALERVDPGGITQDASNWHSAASTAGYGTPTYINSQYKQTETTDATIEVSPKIFSPDNDGHDDITTIRYKLSDAGYVANITIFDAAGRPVRVLVNNGTMASTGYWNWDGLNDKGQKLPIGTYIIYTEIFNLQGKKKHFKNAVVLARRLN